MYMVVEYSFGACSAQPHRSHCFPITNAMLAAPGIGSFHSRMKQSGRTVLPNDFRACCSIDVLICKHSPCGNYKICKTMEILAVRNVI